MLIRCSGHSFGSESEFHCTTHNSAANANSLQLMQFRQRITILCKTHNSAANANPLQPTQFRQRITVSLHYTQLGSEIRIRCRRLSFGSKCYFAAADTVSAANQSFTAQHTIQQRILFCCSRRSFGCESQFRCTTHNSAANANSLQKTQFRQQMLIRCS